MQNPTWTQNVNTLKLHHSRKVMTSIAASLPFARSQIDTGMSGGGVHHLWLDSPPCSWTRSRWRSQSTKSTRSRTPTMRSAMMSTHACAARDRAICQHLSDSVRWIRRTSGLPAVGRDAPVTEGEDDEREARGDQEGPEPIYAPIPRASVRIEPGGSTFARMLTCPGARTGHPCLSI